MVVSRDFSIAKFCINWSGLETKMSAKNCVQNQLVNKYSANSPLGLPFNNLKQQEYDKKAKSSALGPGLHLITKARSGGVQAYDIQGSKQVSRLRILRW